MIMAQRIEQSSLKYDFRGKVALITGSNSGIGAAIAKQLSKYGARVTIHGREEKTLDEVFKEIKQISGHEPLIVQGDLLDQSLPAKLINETILKYGRLDVLVNNAGGGSANDRIANENLMDGYDKVFGLNVRSVIHLTQLAAPHLEKTKGNIINISSVASLQPNLPLYSSSKAALDMFTKSSAQELGPKGIRVNSINPGTVMTRIGRSFGFHEKLFDAAQDQIKELNLLKKNTFPDEIANLASFLASDDAANITGAIIVSDAGCSLKKNTPDI